MDDQKKPAGLQHEHKVSTEGFEGVVVFNVPKFGERLRYIKQCGFKTDAQGSLVISLEDADGLAMMVELAAKMICKVDVTHKESKKVFKDFESMQYDNVCDALLSELGSKALAGFSLGKS